MKTRLSFGFLLLTLAVSGCTTTSASREFNGLSSPDGEVVAHLNSKKIGLHALMGSTAMVGVITIPETVKTLTQEAKELGATRIRIVQSSRTNWWFVFPPISFFITPVTTEVAADALK